MKASSAVATEIEMDVRFPNVWERAPDRPRPSRYRGLPAYCAGENV